MRAVIDFFVNAFERITSYHYVYQYVEELGAYADVLTPPQASNPLWIVSQVFAFIALVFMVWSFQCKEKLRVMLLLGFGTFFLALSAAPLQNWALASLFMQASVRNYVFFFFDWRVKNGIHVPRKYYNISAVIFSVGIVASTIVIIHILQLPHTNYFVEWSIAATLVGLTIGNVLKGQNVMRLSFVVNRFFNIYNHIYFLNAIAVIIAALAIGSNGIYYFRMFLAWRRGEDIQAGTSASDIAAARAAKQAAEKAAAAGEDAVAAKEAVAEAQASVEAGQAAVEAVAEDATE